MATRAKNTHGEQSTADTSGITLLDGERVLENQHPSWSNWWLSFLIGGFLGFIALSSAAEGDMGMVPTITVICALIFGYIYFSRQRSQYIVTDQRVKKKVGLLGRSTGEVRIADIRSLTTGQGLIERLVGKGTVKIDSGGAGGELGIRGVSDHERVAHTIREQQQKVE